MRHFKIKKEYLKYAVLNKTTKKVTIYRFKTQVASLLGVSTKTLSRNNMYETAEYIVYLVDNVLLYR